MKKKKTLIFLMLLPLIFSLLAARNDQTNSSIVFAEKYYDNHLDSLLLWAEQMKLMAPDGEEELLHRKFLEGRAYYKRIEFMADYYFPASAAKLNGAPLPETEPAENLEVTRPQGFQVLEIIVFEEPDEANRKLVHFEVDNIIRTVNKLKSLTDHLEPSQSEILDALRLNIYTMIVKGISGFDAPIALSGVAEAKETLESFTAIMQHFPNAEIVIKSAKNATNYLQNNDGSFDVFDRAVFIRQYVNPLCESLHDYQVSATIPFVTDRRAIRTNARSLFEKEAFDVSFFAPAGTPAATDAQTQLGKKLFSDKRLSATNSRSCESCHQPGRSFTDGLTVNDALAGDKKLLRNTPTLIYAALQPAQFYDSRISFLEDQIHDVVTNRAEMDGNLSAIASKLQKDKDYQTLASDAYGKKLSADVIRKSVAAYIRSLTYLNSAFDQYMRGDAAAMSEQQVRGFNLFMGKAKCGTCHFMPLFNGAAPPFYQKIESEVLGVPKNNDTVSASVDSDSGKFHLYRIPHQLFSFKTVSIRNAAHTAPYMHNGVFRTLEDVIDFYNRGGGVGIGIELENQTLAPDKLHLTGSEKEDMIAFIKALSDRGE